ncbi:uncharacterized protein LOC106464591 isoform X1 [Limulus polyphemus]|uniref:Uncharacterized protein LOC106464591 isoform X1 n=1 Tax=Limulus polyphemus TaxID=6850 RepID=A0ABM1SWM6_LIMPO|nr:uncharacterized protein LOC106464591 isoform X1 [Limulus polyphemus]
MDASSVSSFTDADFDSYWEDESKSKNRNRIRVGRQYQATVPQLLKPGESDGRQLEDLETLKWKPNNDLSDQQLDQFFSVARAVSFFARAIDKYQHSDKESDKCIQTALRGLTEYVTSHHPCHHDANCQLSQGSSDPQPSGSNSSNDWTYGEAQLFARALEACGKNFGAIKKDFLPWKPVKSIIEYYYQGKEERPNSSHNNLGEPSTSMFSVVEPKKEIIDCDDLGDPHTSPDSGSSEEPDNSIPEERIDEPSDDKQDDETGSHPNLPTTSLTAEVLEVKPMKAKPVTATLDLETSPLGSLQFYFHGKLVLKLNAQQHANTNGHQCQWVPSVDTPKVPFPCSAGQCKKKYVELYEDSRTVDGADLQEVEGGFSKKAKLKNDFAIVWPEESFGAPVHSPQSPALSEWRHRGRATPYDGTLSPFSGVCSDPSDSDISPLQSPTDKCSTKKILGPSELCSVKDDLCIKPEPVSPCSHPTHNIEGRKIPFYSSCHKQDPQKFNTLEEVKRPFSQVNCTDVSQQIECSVPISYPSMLKTVLEATDKTGYKHLLSSSYKLSNVKQVEVPLDLSIKSSQPSVNKLHAVETNCQTDGKLNSCSHKQKQLSSSWPDETLSHPPGLNTRRSSKQIKRSSFSSPDVRPSVSSFKSLTSSPVGGISKQHSADNKWTSINAKPLTLPPVISSATNTLHPGSATWTSFSANPDILSPTHTWEKSDATVASLTSYQEQHSGLTYLSMPIYNMAYPYPANCVENVNGVSASTEVNYFSQKNSPIKLKNMEDVTSSPSSKEKEIPAWVTNRPTDLTSYIPLYPHIYSYYPYAYNLSQVSWNGAVTPTEASDAPLDLSSPPSDNIPCSPKQKETIVGSSRAVQVPKDETGSVQEEKSC